MLSFVLLACSQLARGLLIIGRHIDKSVPTDHGLRIPLLEEGGIFCRVLLPCKFRMPNTFLADRIDDASMRLVSSRSTQARRKRE